MKDITENKHGGNAESAAAFEKIEQSLTHRQRVVLGCISTAQQATSKEIAEIMSVPLNVISGRISELKKAGRIKQVGRRDGCAVWQVARFELVKADGRCILLP